MRVVLGFPMQDAQTGVYIKEAFEELGHEVVGIHDPRGQQGAGELISLVDELKPDFVLIAKDPRYNFVIQLVSKLATTAMWNFDARYNIGDFLRTCGPLYDHCHLKFTIEKGSIPLYEKTGIHSIYWLSEGAAPNWHNKTPYTQEDIEKYDADVSFAGTCLGLHEGRAELLDTLTKSQFKYKRWSEVFNLEHNKMVQISKINIGHSGWPKVDLSMSARDYRIMAAGGFLLTNYVCGMEHWFEIGKMCDVYHTPQECLEKIEYYLARPELRNEIREFGYKMVHARHKFSDRIREMLVLVEEYKRGTLGNL